MSGLQCQVKEELYSPPALQKPPGERRDRASRLVDELQKAWDSRANASFFSTGELSDAGLRQLLKESDAIMHFSTVALVQHATISDVHSQSPALESARQALRLNVSAWDDYKHLPDFIWSGHCHWTLMKAPITPFTVTFCHIVAHLANSKADLRLLAEYVATLKNLSRFSDGMVKLYKLCDIFCKVATLYVQAKRNEYDLALDRQHSNGIADLIPGWIGPLVVDEIDSYLSTLGFAPPPSGTATIPNGFDNSADFDASFLVDWYQGNSSLMGFLEQDLMFPVELENDYVSGSLE